MSTHTCRNRGLNRNTRLISIISQSPLPHVYNVCAEWDIQRMDFKNVLISSILIQISFSECKYEIKSEGVGIRSSVISTIEHDVITL